MISGSLKAERERPTEKKVVMSIDHHLVLKLVEMQERVRGSRVVVECRYHKFPREMECGDFLQQW